MRQSSESHGPQGIEPTSSTCRRRRPRRISGARFVDLRRIGRGPLESQRPCRSDHKPRVGPGAITTDTNKCQLKPLNRGDDYGLIPFGDDQWARMQTIFPNGVCDFSLPPVDLQPTIPWLTYQDAAVTSFTGASRFPMRCRASPAAG